MTVWELEEMECVWYHLCHQNSTLWRRPCPHCRKHSLADDLIGHICKRHMDANETGYVYDSNFEEACSSYRLDIEFKSVYQGGITADDLASWPDPLAREPSAGFKFLMDHHDKLRPGEAPPTCSRSALGRFLEWGYCIWDRERLESWRLIESEDGKVRAVYEWWSEDLRRPGEY